MSSATKKRVEEDDGQVKIQALVGLFFVITQFPSLITRYSSLITRNTTPVWHHHSISITQYFSHYLWAPYLSLIAGFFFSIFFSVPKLTEPSGKKKKKRRNPEQTEVKERRRRRKEKKKKKKNNRTTKKKGKKKSKVVKSCSWYCLWVPFCVFNYNIATELWVMDTENS